jgi:hypothetical protein
MTPIFYKSDLNNIQLLYSITSHLEHLVIDILVAKNKISSSVLK